MGGIGFSELLLLALIALLVVGPQRLPEMARMAGQVTRNARGAWQSLKSEFQTELDNEHNRRIMRETEEAARDLADVAGSAEERRSERPGSD